MLRLETYNRFKKHLQKLVSKIQEDFLDFILYNYIRHRRYNFMNSSTKLSKEEMWNAVINCDKNYDSRFLYAVKTTGIVCIPSCKAKTPLKKNVLFFDNINEATSEGFRPCKLCQAKYSNDLTNKVLTCEVKDIIEKSYYKKLDIDNISKELKISKSQLIRLFKKQFSCTPNKYLQKIRICKAKYLLINTNLDMLTIAFEVGFKSISNFYKIFSENFQCSPMEFRNQYLKYK